MKHEAAYIVKLIEEAFQSNPNESIGNLVIRLRQDETYKQTLIKLIIWDGVPNVNG
jgi:hypothetical protein